MHSCSCGLCAPQFGLLKDINSLTVEDLEEQLRQTNLGSLGLAWVSARVLHVAHKTRATTERTLSHVSSSLRGAQDLLLLRRKAGSGGGLGSSANSSGGAPLNSPKALPLP